MKNIKRLYIFLRIPRKQRNCIINAFFELLRAWWLVRFRPFRSFSNELGVIYSGEYFVPRSSKPPCREVVQIAWSLNVMRRLFGKSATCLMLGIAGKRMLSRNGQSNSLVFGIDPQGGSDDEPFGAHAWLLADSLIVTGGNEKLGHTPIVTFFTSCDSRNKNHLTMSKVKE